MTQQRERPAHDSEPIGIIGLGLIGGSLARALHNRAGRPVVGLDRKIAVIETALADKILADAAVLPDLAQRPGQSGKWIDPDSPDFPPLRPVEEAAFRLLAGCEVVFVCTPPATVPAYAKLAARYCDGIISDVASVKQPIMDQVDIERFIGGHPMAGSEQTGYANSAASLLDHAVYVLCLQPDSQLPAAKISQLERLIREIGAIPVRLDAASHDRAVAIVSHLPHVAASGLVLLACQNDGQGTLAHLAAGGFRDITRIASADPSLWASISLENQSEILAALDNYVALLQAFRETLLRGDKVALLSYFSQAAAYRDNLPESRRREVQKIPGEDR